MLLRVLTRVSALLASMILSSALAGGPAATATPDGGYDLIVGTYTGGRSEGLYVYRFDARDGKASPLGIAKTVNPSYVVVSRDRRFVYAVNELPGGAGGGGGVSAFGFDAASGSLTFLNQVASEGGDPCYLQLSPDGRYLLVANYAASGSAQGSFSVLPLAADGRPGAAVQTVRHQGSGPVRGRQDGAHVHSTVFSPDGRLLLVQDLGTDGIYAYRYTPGGSPGPVEPVEWHRTTVEAGTGPRHLIFSGDGHHAYLTSELAGTVSAFSYQDGELALQQVEPLAAPGFTGKVGAAALHLSPDGRFLYVSNRGDANDISIFAVDGRSGRLTRVGRQSSLGRTPREFAIDPTGRWLVVGNQDSDTAYIFRRDLRTGLLGPDPQRLEIGSPVDFKFLAR